MRATKRALKRAPNRDYRKQLGEHLGEQASKHLEGIHLEKEELEPAL